VGLYVQYGAWRDAAPGWINYDASPNVWLERLPVVGILLRMRSAAFPEAIRYGNIVAGLPHEDNSVDGVYASHVLEHLALDEFWLALRNTYRLLKPGGTFRLVVPDLHERARRYLAAVDAQRADAAWTFMHTSALGREERSRKLLSHLRDALGHSHHLWMWDEPSMFSALATVGFAAIRRCEFGDAKDPAFLAVENRSRFLDEETGITELAVEAIKP